MGVTTSIFDAAYSTMESIKAYLGGDEHKNRRPILSSVFQIDAVNHNKGISGIAEIAMRLRPGNLVGYLFSQPDAGASQSAVPLYRGGGGDTAIMEIVAPWNGSVVGLSVHIESARSAGTLTIKWTLNGIEQILSVVIDETNTQNNYAVQLPGVEAFSAGALLGITVTTDGSWAAGSTPSVSVDLTVAYTG